MDKSSETNDLTASTLPIDILGMIMSLVTVSAFQHGLSNDPDPDPGMVEGGIHASLSTLALSHVCCSWRETTLSLAPLWSTLWVPIYPGVEEKEPHFLSMCLKRSRGSPLAVIVRFFGEYHDVNKPLGEPKVVRLILAHSSKWRSLHLWNTTASISEFFISTSYPNLYHLDYREHYARRLKRRVFLPGARTRILDSFEKSSSLKTLALHCYKMPDQHLPGLSIPWHQLTTCELFRARIPTCLGMLELAPNLINCRLIGCHVPHDNDLRHSSPLASLRIQNFKLTFYAWRDYFEPVEALGLLFGCLNLPAVRSLDLDLVEAGHDQMLINFLSNCDLHNIQTLKLRKVRNIPESEWCELLLASDNLHTLVVESDQPYCFMQLLRSLATSPGGNPVRLKRLELIGYPLWEKEAGSLLDNIVRSRHSTSPDSGLQPLWRCPF